jgi:phospholipid/cholesterol/gamma-HCH transport system ATP-binding protein
MDPIIEVRGLSSEYDGEPILKNINIEVYPKEIMVILGPSGCGKSTLLKHIVGLLDPVEGGVSLFGRPLDSMTEEEYRETLKNMGMLFQGGALLGSMTVGENVALPIGEHTDLDEETIRLIVSIKLSLVGLAGCEDMMPSQLSGGMRKRAGLARALALDPEVLLFDEPTAGLDPITSAGMDRLILRLRRALSMTGVIVTHELKSVRAIADRVTLLDEGEVIAYGSLYDVETSQEPRVRRFLEATFEEPGPSELLMRTLVPDEMDSAEIGEGPAQKE